MTNIYDLANLIFVYVYKIIDKDLLICNSSNPANFYKPSIFLMELNAINFNYENKNYINLKPSV
jgi:hypothetical protein